MPVARAGLYVPGGRASYPSTVLMTAIPARVAGVAELALCVPPDRDGAVPPATLAAAALAGVDEVYRVGGAQAIAALAYGTETIRATDVIVGPGNVYVALAKREVAGVVGIESYAGPSEVVVVADATAPPELAAVDLLAQAEHGPGGSAVLITWLEPVADAVADAVEKLLADAPRRAEIEATLSSGGRIVLVDGPDAALAAANAIAPEHLELMTADPEALLGSVRNAGAVFLGPWAPAVVGDYVAGVNHVLPTARTARYASGAAGRHLLEARPRRRSRRRGPGPRRTARPGARGSRGAGRARPLGRVPRGAVVTAARRPSLPAPRDDLLALDGYHSPQLDVDVRLNTNESPYPPPREFIDTWLAALGEVPLHRYPDRGAHRLREGLATHLGQRVDRVFCANGSNEVLQTLLLTYAGAGRRAIVFEPTYALHSHIARITGTEVVSATRADDFTVSPTEAGMLIAAERPAVVFLCSPRTGAAATACRRAGAGELGLDFERAAEHSRDLARAQRPIPGLHHDAQARRGLLRDDRVLGLDARAEPVERDLELGQAARHRRRARDEARRGQRDKRLCREPDERKSRSHARSPPRSDDGQDGAVTMGQESARHWLCPGGRV